MNVPIPCPQCGSTRTRRHGFDGGRQRIFCHDCRRRLTIGERKRSAMTNEVKMGASGVVTLEKIKTRFDIASAILREIGKIEKGTLISETELSQRAAGYDKQRFRRTVENNEELFSPHRVSLKLDEGDKKWFWGAVDDIAESIRMRDL